MTAPKHVRPRVPADHGGSLYRPDHKPRHKKPHRDVWTGNQDTDKHWAKQS